MAAKNSLMIRKLGDELLLLDPERDRVHQLNATASLIWELNEAGMAPEEIAERLASTFEVVHSEAEADVEITLAAFRERGLAGG